MTLTTKEKQIILDTDFLKSKIIVIDKIQRLFEEVRISMSKSIKQSNFSFPIEVDSEIGKIFKGENYNLLPYVTLDYPKLFNKEDVFTFRTMFWWGNFFSATLHISGEYLDIYMDQISQNLPKYLNNNIYICVNDSPWEYHYGNDNYVLLTVNNLDLLKENKFLKLSKKYSLEEYKTLPKLVNEFLNLCIIILS